MKSDSNEKEKDLWNKYRLMGKKKYVILTTLSSTGLMLIFPVIAYFLCNQLFGIPNYSSLKILLTLVIYTILVVFIGLKLSVETWERRTIIYDGVIKIEIDDAELRRLILKGEKIMAVKRYRIVTGKGFKDALRYVDLFSVHYLNS